MNDEWNNENSAVSVAGVIAAIAGIVLAIIIIALSLAAPAHAQEPVTLTVPTSPLVDGSGPSAVTLDGAETEAAFDWAQVLAICVAGGLLAATLHRRRRR